MAATTPRRSRKPAFSEPPRLERPTRSTRHCDWSAPAANLTSFPAAYFAEAQPTTAMDMILRLPGFVFDSGAQVRLKLTDLA